MLPSCPDEARFRADGRIAGRFALVRRPGPLRRTAPPDEGLVVTPYRPDRDPPVSPPPSPQKPGDQLAQQGAPRGPLRGVYAITPDEADAKRLLPAVAHALEGGLDALQFRVKGGTPNERLELAMAVLTLTSQAGVPLIVNDDVELACAVNAEGVHIGRDDGDPVQVRARIGPHRWLGVSCYNDLQRAHQLSTIADHVGFGSVFASPTKPHAVRAPLSLFGEARAAGLNTVGIGGIDRSNAAQVIAAGADAVAIITDIFSDRGSGGGGTPVAQHRA
jgi:thiamine-phosphate pyrophosphorylase